MSENSPFAALVPDRPLNAEFAASVEHTTAVVTAVTDEQLAAPTPCGDWNLAALVNHVIWGAEAGTRAGLRAPVPTDGSEDRDADRLTGDWRARYAESAAAAGDAWGKPDAWDGETSLVGGPMPAGGLGSLFLVDMVVHGWDVARAAGRAYTPDEDAVRAVHDWLATRSEVGRGFGAWGPEVPVPATAPLFARVLGLTGRDPHWGGARTP
ncbi:TIGR03086 family metal-binding protein [Longispora sp. NPDC051575]|uniref:TIGR03086 family metal-binding protein n=1 Tax=Longispora sp. NPDC051575 TaxID=3154943 RepID=UPI00341D1DF6